MRGAGSFTARLAPEQRFGAAGLGRRRISRPPDASVSRGGGVWERLRCGCRWHRECCGWRAAMRAAAWLRAPRAVPCCSAAPGLRALGCFVDAGWQDSRAVHDSRGPCSEKCPFLAGSSRGVSSNGGLRGISDAWRAYLARKGRFSRPRPLSGCMGRKNCHGLPPGNAPRKNIATASQAKNALRRNPATAGRWETHLASILPSASARERIRAQSCHRQAPGNTSMKNLHNRHLTIVYKSLTRNQAEYNKEIGF